MSRKKKANEQSEWDKFWDEWSRKQESQFEDAIVANQRQLLLQERQQTGEDGVNFWEWKEHHFSYLFSEAISNHQNTWARAMNRVAEFCHEMLIIQATLGELRQ